MKWKIFYLIVFVFLLAACGAESPSEVAEPEIAAPIVVDTEDAVVEAEPEVMEEAVEETAVPETEAPAKPTEVPTAAPVEESEPTPKAETEENVTTEENVAEEAPTAVPVEEKAGETAVNVIAGRTPEGAFFLGDPNAPLTMIDYSDFL